MMNRNANLFVTFVTFVVIIASLAVFATGFNEGRPFHIVGFCLALNFTLWWMILIALANAEEQMQDGD